MFSVFIGLVASFTLSLLLGSTYGLGLSLQGRFLPLYEYCCVCLLAGTCLWKQTCSLTVCQYWFHSLLLKCEYLHTVILFCWWFQIFFFFFNRSHIVLVGIMF